MAESSCPGAIEMVDNEFAMLKKNKTPDGQVEISSLTTGISLQNLSYSYDGKTETLKNISMDIPANSTIALVGASGAVKSTLVDLLTILLRPTRGDLLIDGHSAFNVKLASWRCQIGYVSQETVMFDDTVVNNIGLWTGDYESDADYRKRIHEASRQARADVFINDLKDGFKTLIGDRGIRLSGGQRQRLFVARELFKNPRLLILDEANFRPRLRIRALHTGEHRRPKRPHNRYYHCSPPLECQERRRHLCARQKRNHRIRQLPRTAGVQDFAVPKDDRDTGALVGDKKL